ncbi:MAG: hypothetical protein LBS73_04920 [Campylobacteraceae bacterium]|jgi:hypothetical protein|nr:hypothetical protein [Campylobacteraceae bacterium]
MKTLVGFLLLALAVIFLAGCGSSGGGGSNTSGKCSSSNPTMPSMKTALKDIFPQSLLDEPYNVDNRDMSISFLPVNNTASYEQKVVDSKNFISVEKEKEFVRYSYYGNHTNSNITYVEIAIYYDDRSVQWLLSGHDVEIYESDFNSNIFPSTGAPQDEVSFGRFYDTDKSSSFDRYVAELERKGFHYDVDYDGWEKESSDKCFVYNWSKSKNNNGTYTLANWGIYSKVY